MKSELVGLMGLTIEKAKTLKHGEIIYAPYYEHELVKWRVNGKVKLWKRSPDRIEIPVKYGIYRYGYVTEKNIHLCKIEP